MGRELRQPVSIEWLATVIGCEYSGENTTIQRVDSAAGSGNRSLCFAKNSTWASRIKTSGVVLGNKPDLEGLAGAFIYSSTARLDFARLLSALDSSIGFVWSQSFPEIHPTVRIGANVVIGKGARIGAGTVIANNVVIGAEVIIGERCNIKSCSVIGEEGFGFERGQSGSAVRLPHIGSVVIGDGVEIGSLSTVCRGTLEDTVVCDGAKIDDHVHIAHNVYIGEDTFVIACAEISGGVKIGRRAWIAPGATVLNQIIIGDDAVVGLGAVVVKNIEAGVTVVGNPARSLNRPS